ncbi:type II toxin-antitoxin system Phd/YefM family antitoxin [Microbacterium sp. JB110]|uniref:type II toxin-antitoxin system Phd/YefM family antitoxin n=1 Tax=Microbacterium sp. JB110 TaxID=2024477 RepID=UPI00097E7FEA|nr:type II toxin-antitoxin system prevent-host-death family antitoxin [Microbacterium sp. JB110]RCS62859.1 type II toxin-antitoxin system Phd/YefM family antitoxin [Microbacterium sp. JB110]SJM62007.1 Prevent-host-death protein [Frigoribacterium sp. JB110]
MQIVNMHEAKTHLSRLVDAAVDGESITIAKAGKPLVRLVRIEAEDVSPRLGFLRGQGQVPSDFDSMGDEEIANLFEGTR